MLLLVIKDDDQEGKRDGGRQTLRVVLREERIKTAPACEAVFEVKLEEEMETGEEAEARRAPAAAEALLEMKEV